MHYATYTPQPPHSLTTPRTPLVFIHGASGDHRHFQPQLQNLGNLICVSAWTCRDTGSLPDPHRRQWVDTPTQWGPGSVSYTHLRAHETKANLVCRLLLEKKKK